MFDNFLTEKSICRNCGHPIQRVGFMWCHLNEYGNQLTHRCWETTDCDCHYPSPDRRKQ